MAFGIGDLFGILGGGAWLAKEGVREISERTDNRNNKELIDAFVAEHTDLELEEKLKKDLLNPALHDSIWAALESYKRDNPVWCKQHEKSGWYGEYTQQFHEPNFGWQDIGNKRVPLLDAKGTVRGKNAQEEGQLAANRNLVLQMLMEMNGKMRHDIALLEARRKYPLPKSNRSW